MRVSLICTVLNEADSLPGFLSSLAAQERLPDEVVITDAGSTDQTVQLLRAFARRFARPVRIIHATGNRSVGRNVAIASAAHDVIACTDAGCELAPDWLARLVSPMEEDSTVDVVGGFYEARGETSFERAAGVITASTRGVTRHSFLPSARSLAFRRRAWQTVGGFPEHLEFAEDTFFDVALRDAECRFAFAPDAVVYWRPRSSIGRVFRQAYDYAAGNAEAGLLRMSHARIYVRYLIWVVLSVALVLKPAVFALWLVALVPYWLVWVVFGWRAYHDRRVALTAPFAKLVGDAGKMTGFAAGLRRRELTPHLLYFTTSPLGEEPYTHSVVARILQAAQGSGHRVALRVPDDPQAVRSGFVEANFARERGQALRIESCRRFLAGASARGIVLCAGSLDWWRLAIRHPLRMAAMKRLFWLQGLESEESWLKHRSWLRRIILSVSESLAVWASTVTIVPSPAMACLLQRRYPFLRGSRVVVLPNLVDGPAPAVADAHVRWGFSQRPGLTLGYSGGLSAWQCFEETCRIVAGVQARLPDSWFLVLTRQAAKARECLRQCGIMRCKVKAAARREVCQYISAFDIGFMLRRDHVVNHVACPVKWLEHWRCGVPLVTTRAVAIVDEAACSRHNCVVDLGDERRATDEVVRFARRLAHRSRTVSCRLKHCVSARWSWDAWQEAIERIFAKLTS